MDDFNAFGFLNRRVERKRFLPAISGVPWLLFGVLFTGCGDQVPLNPPPPVTFGESAKYAVGKTPISLALGDLDADGTVDLAVANHDVGSVSVLLNLGDGTFAAAVTYDFGAYFANSVAVADVDGDGRLDLLVGRNAVAGDGNFSVRLNTGDGTLGPAIDHPVEGGEGNLAVGDLNADGLLDVAISTGAYVSVLLNSGKAVFTSPIKYEVNAGSGPMSTDDFNGDGAIDLVIANGCSGCSRPAVLLNKGDGTFATASFYVAGANPDGVATGDLNGDGHVDLAVSTAGYPPQPGGISVLLNRGDGTFADQVRYIDDAGPTSIASGDLNHDGSVDLAIANGQSGNVAVYLNYGNGTFAAPANHAAGGFPLSVRVGDLNRDGNLDLVVANFNDRNVTVLLNTSR